MYVLGISALTHDSAAALLGDQGVVAAIEEGKLERSRSAIGLPRKAIRFCLEQARIEWKDLDAVAIASRPVRAWLRRSHLLVRSLPVAPVSTSYHETKALGELARDLNNLRVLGGMSGRASDAVIPLDHHLCHASSAFYASSFDRALILTCDEHGDGISSFAGIGEGTQIKPLERIPFPHSLAWVYTQVTELLGFLQHEHEHKAQWLSLNGSPVFARVFRDMFRPSHAFSPRLNLKFFNAGLTGHVAFSTHFYRQIGIASHLEGELLPEEIRADVASSMQHAFAEILVEYLESLRRQTSAESLCLAGGLFLNPLLVEAIEAGTAFSGVFVQPAAGNEGTSLGAAWFVRHHLRGEPRQEPMAAPYWGPGYTDEQVKQVLDNCKATYHWLDSDAQKVEGTLRLLHAGKIVAWYQGRAEFGPRALGNRSLLASPWAPYVKENLNDYVKHRESFRPFALAVPEEDAQRYFECTPLGRFMATMARVRPEFRELLKDHIQPGDRVRLHVVSRIDNPPLWRLLRRMGETSNGPLLVNTSFNLFGEPLVISPRDALRSFYCSGVDAMVLEDFLLTKATAQNLLGSEESESSARWSRA
jgi:carbamoyltransferase